MIQESPPTISNSEITLSLMMALKTYKGEVPISPYIIPKATSKPAAVTLLTLFDTTFIFWVSKHSQQKHLRAGYIENTNTNVK